MHWPSMFYQRKDLTNRSFLSFRLPHLIKKAGNHCRVDVFFYEGAADAARQNKGQCAARDFLVLRDGCHQSVGGPQRAGDIL